MSHRVALMSFDKARFDSVFGGGEPGAARAVFDARFWEEIGTDDDPPGIAVRRAEVIKTPTGANIWALAEKITQHGLSFDGLSDDDAQLLDGMINGWGNADAGLDKLLDMKQHSDPFGYALLEHISAPPRPPNSSMLRRIMDWGAHAKKRQGQILLPLLFAGRRFGTVAIPPCRSHRCNLYCQL